MTGLKFGRWTVIERSYDNINKNGIHIPYWICQCSCENKTIKRVKGYSLTSGNSKSCGCLRFETKNKKYNEYDLSGDYGIGYDNNGKCFYFDLEDYDLIKDYCWHINDSGYVITSVNNSYIRMHRLVMGVTNKEMIVDHIHGCETKNDNRKCNLRIATKQENNRNSKLSKNNSSGTTGVHWSIKENKWIARITDNYKENRIGCFSKKDDAILARKRAEKILFKNFSYDYSQNLPYRVINNE